MRMNRGFGRPNTSSQIYRKRENMTFWQRFWNFIMYVSRVGWSFMKQSGWIVTSGFVILVLPSILLQMFEYESLLSKDLEPNSY